MKKSIVLFVVFVFITALAVAQDKAPAPAAKPAAPAAKPAADTSAAKKGKSKTKAKAEAKAIAPVDINTATEKELDAIPGIGAAKAKAIIAARPFKSVDDLKKVKGIGGGKAFEKIKPYVLVK